MNILRTLYFSAALGSIICAVFFPLVTHAQTLTPDRVTVEKARVLEVMSQEERIVPGTDVRSTYQTLKVKVLEGEEKDQELTIENDYLNLAVGEVFYVRHTVNALDGTDLHSVSDPYRMPTIWFFVILFIVCVLIFGGKQGIRGLIALALSFLFIFYLLLPGILHGVSPVFVALGVSSLIVVLGSYITHGFNRVTSCAVAGMVATIVVTGILAFVAIHWGRLSGFATEEAVFLNLDTRGSIDFAGLLLGGMLIGLLGVLYDAAIGQAVAVEELSSVGGHLSRPEIFRRALRIGREHIGALVNTLAIAYVGASLPLLLLLYHSPSPAGLLVNQELFATEIIRIMIGSIGLVLAVPVTTAIATYLLIKKD